MAPLPALTINGWLRYDLVLRLLEELDDVHSVLEIGAGEGALGVRLAARYRYVGYELDRRSFERAASRFARAGVRSIVQGDVSAEPPDEKFDLVCAFEVLEHFEDDRAVLASWSGYLRPHGWLIVSTPAHPGRFGAWDRKAGHYRRYERDRLAQALESAGFEPRSIWAVGFPLGNLLEHLRNQIARRSGGDGEPAARTARSGRLLQPRDELGWLTSAISRPARVAQRRFVDTDRGTGFVALAQKARPLDRRARDV